MAAADWKAIENAIVAWVKTASGLTSNGGVILGDQRHTSPALPYVHVRLGSVLPIGMDTDTHEFDGAAPAGEEITLKATGLRSFTASIQAHEEVGSGFDAAARLSKVQSALALSSVRGTFHAAGISCYDRGTVQNLSGLGADFEGRAALEVAFYVNEEVSEKTTWIETVEVSTNLPGGANFEVG